MLFKKKILVTGYNGYIGRNLIKFLKKKKIKYKLIDISKILNEDFKDYTHLIHLKFFIMDEKKYIYKNLSELKKVLKLCKINDLKLIFPSTSSFKFQKNKRVNNNIYVHNYYTLSKKKCESEILKFCNDFKMDYVILRIFNVYGGDIKNKYYISKLTSEFIKAKKFQKIYVPYSENMRDYIHINDLFSLLLKILNKNINGIFEAGSGKSVTIKKLVKNLNELLNKKNKIIYSSPKKSNKNFFSKSKINRTVKTFNWKPKIFLNKGLVKLIRNL